MIIGIGIPKSQSKIPRPNVGLLSRMRDRLTALTYFRSLMRGFKVFGRDPRTPSVSHVAAPVELLDAPRAQFLPATRPPPSAGDAPLKSVRSGAKCSASSPIRQSGVTNLSGGGSDASGRALSGGTRPALEFGLKMSARNERFWAQRDLLNSSVGLAIEIQPERNTPGSSLGGSVFSSNGSSPSTSEKLTVAIR